MSVDEINRSILLVRPRQPYLDWADSLPNPTPVTLEDLREDCSAYLLAEIVDPGDELAVLQNHYAAIFEHELAGWVTEEGLWPHRRTLSMFTEWFDLEFHGMVFDLCGDEVSRFSADDG